MFSLGIDASLAFCTAVARVGFPSMSPPPSRAATMIARASFENSLPRFASAAPFLCLIDDHLLCPDNLRLPHEIEEHFVQPRLAGELRMERRDEEPALPREHR